MHQVAIRTIGPALGRVPPVTLVALVALVVSIVVVELGWRDPAPGMLVNVPTPGPFTEPIEQLRSVPLNTISDPRAAAIASGVIFGRTEHVAPVDEQAFLDSGLWHLLAASGQNIALVAGCCVLLARSFGAGRTTGGVMALLAIPAYVMVVGGGASIVRAGLMGELVLVAWLAGRIADLKHLLVVVAAVICWTWPGAHRGLGMQLSFACVVALVLGAGPVTRSLQERGVPVRLAGAVAATALCSVVTAPLLVLRTGGAPVTGVLANLVAVPVAGGLLVIGLAGAIVAAVASTLGLQFVATLAMYPAGVLAGVLVHIAERAAAMPGAQTTSKLVALGVPAAIALLVLVGRCGWPRARVRRARVAVASCVGAVLIAASAWPSAATSLPDAAPGAGVLRVGVLDVGQGDATLLVSGTHAVLVDTGPPDGRVVQRIRELGVDRLDGIVLTHDSLDHRGGFDAAHAALDPGWVAMPRAAPGPWQRIGQLAPNLVELCAGDGFDVGGARVDVLHPRCDGTITPLTGDVHNDGAMVLLARSGAASALLPADAESPVLTTLGVGRVDLLRVAHHGSEDPQLPELLARTTPAVAAISAGRGNSYGHPRRDVLDALEDAGTRTLRTDRDGTVVVDLHDDRLVVHAAR